MHPQPISRLQIRNVGDGQSYSSALDTDSDLGPDEIKCRVFSAGDRDERQQDQKKTKRSHPHAAPAKNKAAQRHSLWGRGGITMVFAVSKGER